MEEKAAEIEKLRNENPEEYMRLYYGPRGDYELSGTYKNTYKNMLVHNDADWLKLPVDSCLRHTEIDWKTTSLIFLQYATTGTSISIRTASFDQEHDTVYIYRDTRNQCYGTPPPTYFVQHFLDVPAHILAKATEQTKFEFVDNHTYQNCGMVP